MAAKFEIRSAKAGEFNWVLKSQGRTLASGESYTRKVSAEKAIDSLRKAAASAAVADLTLAPAKTPAKAPAKAATKATKAAKKGVAKAKATAKKATTGRKGSSVRGRTARKG